MKNGWRSAHDSILVVKMAMRRGFRRARSGIDTPRPPWIRTWCLSVRLEASPWSDFLAHPGMKLFCVTARKLPLRPASRRRNPRGCDDVQQRQAASYTCCACVRAIRSRSLGPLLLIRGRRNWSRKSGARRNLLERLMCCSVMGESKL